MIVLNILANIFTNAFTYEKLNAVFYSRTNQLYTIVTIYLTYSLIYITNISKGIGVYNGLFNISHISQVITLFMLVITCIILTYNSFYFFDIKILNRLPLKGKDMINKSYLKLIENEDIRNSSISKILKEESKSETYLIVEYGLIINFIICGGLFLMTSGDLISLFISLELQSYGLYVLCTIHKDSEQATWGGLIYFLLGGLSSCFVLLGSSLIYINTGTTVLDGFYIINNVSNLAFKAVEDIAHSVSNDNQNIITEIKEMPAYNYLFTSYINISLVILITGFLFKISAAPFHFWSPDVYDAIPTTVTTYVALIAKLSIFVLLLELVYYIYGNLEITNEANGLIFTWKNCLYLSSMLSLIVGSVLGLSQVRIKRLYAYSTISHVGFILLSLCIDKIESISAYLFYILSYTISNLNAFVILTCIGYTMYACVPKNTNNSLKQTSDLITYENKAKGSRPLSINDESQKHPFIQEKLDKASNSKNEKLNIQVIFDNLNLKDIKYSPIQLIVQLKGYFYVNPHLAISLAITLFSFMGIPPLIGFFAKQMVLSAALDNGYIFITLIGIITSVIGAAYYLNIIKFMFFYNSDLYIPAILHNSHFFVSINAPLSIIISILTLILALFMAIPNEIVSLTKVLVLLLYI